MPNKLAGETSPYLRQHKDNPVDWYPWGASALSRARNEDKPIFLSIGYSACHWCHVMAHESFEDPDIAKLLNDHFISIKVDREERPDLDDVYMQAVVMLRGQGGWPLSVFLTPELEPFYGGTYFPPEPRYGMPSFKQLLLSVLDSWNDKREEIYHSAKKITEAIEFQFDHEGGSKSDFDFDRIIDSLYRSYDWQFGGWGHAPKFPPAMLAEFLTQQAWRGNVRALEMSEHLLAHMAKGGMYDLVGGGFHRYSVDRQWLVPHFEKMLYDNAQLAQAYLHGFAVTGNPWFRRVAIQTLEFIQTEMTSPEGGFYSSLDADTPEGEGRYYSWDWEMLKTTLSPSEFELLETITTVSTHGNFEEKLNILQFKDTITTLAKEMKSSNEQILVEAEAIFDKLLKHRQKRQPPEKDTKIIVSWNALAIRAFVSSGLLLGRKDFIATARKATEFILAEMILTSGKLNRVWHEGQTNHPGTLSDYAGMILALHALYEMDFSPEIYAHMHSLYSQLNKQFASENPFYFDSAEDVGHLIVRPRSLQDNAIPSGNALVAHVLWLFWNYEYDESVRNELEEMLGEIAEQADHYPNHFGYWLQIADRHSQKVSQVALVAENDLDSLNPFLKKYHRTYHPHGVIAAGSQQESGDKIPALLKDKTPVNHQPAAYICYNFTCQRPIIDPEAFNEALMNVDNQ